MKSMKRRVGAPLPPSTADARAAEAINTIRAMEGEPAKSGEACVSSVHGRVAMAIKSKKINMVNRGERYQQAVRAIRTVDAVIANRVLTPPGRKPPSE